MNGLRLFGLIVCWFPLALTAQTKDSSIFSFPIQMDEVVVTAARSGWDVQGFIHRIKNDTTFFKAFKSLRVTPHSIRNHIVIRGKSPAAYQSTTQQIVVQGCRSMQVQNEQVKGSFYDKNGDFRYLTAELYAHLFFTKGTICGETDVVAHSGREKGKLGKYKWQLKQLIFNPGSSIGGVPFMGNKESIFDPEVARMYDFKLSSEHYDGEDCYLFKALPKKEFEKDVVFNELSTWFRKSDYRIVARNYSLSYKTLPYDFHVVMMVRLQQVGSKLLPQHITYEGKWRAVTKGKEDAYFTADFSYP